MSSTLEASPRFGAEHHEPLTHKERILFQRDLVAHMLDVRSEDLTNAHFSQWIGQYARLFAEEVEANQTFLEFYHTDQEAALVEATRLLTEEASK